MIPKKIHYCWFGGNKLTPLAQKCINSWKKFCPDYEIVEWNENNFDIHSNKFVEDAYNAQKYAFVTDYVRLFVTYTYGGIYMDTDVEVIKPLDCFLKYDAFSGFEKKDALPTGIMACGKGFPFFKFLMKDYDDLTFVNDPDHWASIINVKLITRALTNAGAKLNNCFQVVEGFALYPTDYFCPKDYETGIISLTENTYTIHHFSGSWIPKQQRRIIKIKKIIKSIVGSQGIQFVRSIKTKLSINAEEVKK